MMAKKSKQLVLLAVISLLASFLVSAVDASRCLGGGGKGPGSCFQGGDGAYEEQAFESSEGLLRSRKLLEGGDEDEGHYYATEVIDHEDLRPEDRRLAEDDYTQEEQFGGEGEEEGYWGEERDAPGRALLEKHMEHGRRLLEEEEAAMAAASQEQDAEASYEHGRRLLEEDEAAEAEEDVEAFYVGEDYITGRGLLGFDEGLGLEDGGGYGEADYEVEEHGRSLLGYEIPKKSPPPPPACSLPPSPPSPPPCSLKSKEKKSKPAKKPAKHKKWEHETEDEEYEGEDEHGHKRRMKCRYIRERKDGYKKHDEKKDYKEDKKDYKDDKKDKKDDKKEKEVHGVGYSKSHSDTDDHGHGGEKTSVEDKERKGYGAHDDDDDDEEDDDYKHWFDAVKEENGETRHMKCRYVGHDDDDDDDDEDDDDDNHDKHKKRHHKKHDDDDDDDDDEKYRKRKNKRHGYRNLLSTEDEFAEENEYYEPRPCRSLLEAEEEESEYHEAEEHPMDESEIPEENEIEEAQRRHLLAAETTGEIIGDIMDAFQEWEDQNNPERRQLDEVMPEETYEGSAENYDEQWEASVPLDMPGRRLLEADGSEPGAVSPEDAARLMGSVAEAYSDPPEERSPPPPRDVRKLLQADSSGTVEEEIPEYETTREHELYEVSEEAPQEYQDPEGYEEPRHLAEDQLPFEEEQATIEEQPIFHEEQT